MSTVTPPIPSRPTNTIMVSWPPRRPVYAYDGDLTAFCGPTGTLTLPDASACALFQRPDVVMQGRDCTNYEAALFILGGVLQHKLALQPGEERRST